MAIKRTNRGATIDMDALIANSGPASIAVGNMRVNAKGDRIGSGGSVVQKNEDRVRDHYRDNVRVTDTKTSIKGTPPPAAPVAKKKVVPDVAPEPEEFAAPAEQEAVGFKEVELPNGDIEMVPVYKSEDEL